MKAAPPALSPDASAEPEALIREARRRQRRRRLAVGLAGAAALAAAAGVAAGVAGHSPVRPARHGHPGPRPPARQTAAPGPIPGGIGSTLLMWPAGYPAFGPGGGPPANVDDLSTGQLTHSRQPAISAGDYQPLLAQLGHWLVYVGDAGTSAVPDDLTGRPRVLGPTPFFAPAAAPGRVWLFRPEHGVQGPIRAWTVAASGGGASRPVTLPAGAYLPAIRGTDAGLLLQVPRGLALWKPGGGPRLLPSPADLADGFDATARLVAYGAGCTSRITAPDAPQDPGAGYDTCRILRVMDVVTGKRLSFPAPPGTAGWVPDGFNLVSAISPAGQMIAAYAVGGPRGAGRARLYVLKMAGPARRATAVPSSTGYLFARTAWSADGTWLLYQGPGGHLRAYQVTSGQTRALRTPCCRYTVMTAMPGSNG